jgi:hypothetical protein
VPASWLNPAPDVVHEIGVISPDPVSLSEFAGAVVEGVLSGMGFTETGAELGIVLGDAALLTF